jgi:broad specificity phosphatase PhoE
MTPPARTLILVKHAMPAIDPARPAHEWPLAEAGRRSCAPLAAALAAYQPAQIVTSTEPKAAETGRRVAEALGLPCATAPDLHEHDRANVGWIAEPTAFRAAVAAFFAHPDQLVLGRETAARATTRFTAAVDAALARHPAGTLVIVAHGTVIALYAAARAGLAPYPLWQRLGLPSFVALALPDHTPLAIVGEIAPAEAPPT